ncbi:MAG: SDR family NAD(P)-dependent oxidoreductase [Nitrososphaerales archaeon]
MSELSGLRDKVAMITGGSGGLGEELAVQLAPVVGSIIICSRNEKDLLRVCDMVREKGAKCDYLTLDVTDQKQVDSSIDKILTSHGKIDILINNAGYVEPLNRVENTTYQELENNFKTNVYSIFFFLKRVVPIMRGNSYGRIVNISSYAGKRGIPRLSLYSASKFAVVGLTQAVAKELTNTNVSCIAICPGGMNTKMRISLFGEEEAAKQQSASFVAEVIRDILLGKIFVPNGGDIVVRHGKIVSINSPPE